MEAFLGFYLLFWIVYYVLVLGIGLASYIMQALGLQRIAKKVGILHPWLSWLPVGREWIFGSIADSFDRARGLNRKWRTALLVSSILTIIFFVVFYVALIAIILITALAAEMGEFATGVGAIAAFVVIFVGVLALAFAATALGVLNICCLYKVYDEICPEKTLKYLLLSFLVPLGHEICLLRAGKRYEPAEEPIEQTEPTYYSVPVLENETPTSESEDEI